MPKNVKQLANEYLHQALLDNEDAMNYLHSRDITEKDIETHSIGYSDGNLFDDLLKELGDETSTYQKLVKSGIAKMSGEGSVTNFITPDTFTFPAIENGHISYWVLRQKEGFHSPIPKEKRDNGTLFLNQKAFSHKEIWIVKEPWDLIQMAKKKINCIATENYMSRDQLEFIRNFSDPENAKIFHVLYTSDASGAGLKSANWFANEVCDFHQVYVHKLATGISPEKYLTSKGNLQKLNKEKIEKRKIPVEERGRKYYYRTGPQKTEVVSNFIVEPEYVIINDDGTKRYEVTIHTEDNKAGPFAMDAGDWASEVAFRKWIGFCDGNYTFSGNIKQLMDCKSFWFSKKQPKEIKRYDGYGNVDKDLWLYDNAAIYKSVVHLSDEDGICWLPDGNDLGVEGVQTITRFTELEGKWLVMPEEKDMFEIDDIVAGLGKYYKEKFVVWPIIGYATAIIYFKMITAKYGMFPVLFTTGQTESGKTRFSRIIASLVGSGRLETPAGMISTAKGIIRYLSRHYSIPLVINEFEEKSKQMLIHALYDLDLPTRAKYSNDNRVDTNKISTGACMTSIKTPTREDLLNRLYLINFNGFKKNKSLANEFDNFWSTGVRDGKNTKFLLEILRSDCRKNVIPFIEKARKSFIDRYPDVSSRQLLINSIVIGSFLAACESLDLLNKFEKFGMEVPNKENIGEFLQVMTDATELLVREEKELSHFFQLLYSLHLNGKTKECCWVDNGEIYFNLQAVYSHVKKEDRMSGNQKLEGVSVSWIRNHLKIEMKDLLIKTSHNKYTSKSMRVYIIDMEKIREYYNVTLEEEDEDLF